jgi:hypothetical protein
VHPTQPAKMTRLPLRDELFLISHDDDRGKPHIFIPSLAVGLAGAALIDLFMAARVDIQRDHIVDFHRGPVGDLITDSAMAAIRNSRPVPVPVKQWLRGFADGIYERVRANMVAVGVLRQVPRRLRSDLFLPIESAWSVRSRAQVRSVLYGHDQPDPQCAALCGLIAALGLQDLLYLDERGRDVQAGLRRVASGHFVPVRDIIRAVEDVVGDLATAVYR